MDGGVDAVADSENSEMVSMRLGVHLTPIPNALLHLAHALHMCVTCAFSNCGRFRHH